MGGDAKSPWRPFALRLPQPPLVRWLAGLAVVGLILLVWWLVTRGDTAEARIVSPALLPSLGEVFRSAPALVGERGLGASIVFTLRRLFLGFGLAVLLGVPLGMLAGMYRVVDAAAAPLAILGRNIPVAALIPLTMLWFGIDEMQKVMFIFVATVPFVFTDAARAVIQVHERFVETAVTVGAKTRHVIFKVLVPMALPDIYESNLNLFGLAFGYIMLAELVNAGAGLGYLLSVSQRRGPPEHIFLILVVIGVLAWAIYQVGSFFGRGLFPYRQAARD